MGLKNFDRLQLDIENGIINIQGAKALKKMVEKIIIFSLLTYKYYDL